MLTNLQFQILKRISPGAPDCCSGSTYEGKSKLATLMGEDIFRQIAGKVIIDFGCGEGAEALEMALKAEDAQGRLYATSAESFMLRPRS
jgi:ubiquinone/menaquinone biosynthesis C-methylase UbiE